MYKLRHFLVSTKIFEYKNILSNSSHTIFYQNCHFLQPPCSSGYFSISCNFSYLFCVCAFAASVLLFQLHLCCFSSPLPCCVLCYSVPLCCSWHPWRSQRLVLCILLLMLCRYRGRKREGGGGGRKREEKSTLRGIQSGWIVDTRDQPRRKGK